MRELKSLTDDKAWLERATAGLRFFSYTSDLSMYFAGWGSPLGGATPSTTNV